MLTCKQVSRALQDRDYATLPWHSRLALRLHIALCVVCGRYNRQIMDFHDCLRAFARHEEDDQSAAAGTARLPQPARERLRDALARATNRP